MKALSRIMFVLLLIGSSAVLTAQNTPQDYFFKANKEYDNGNYQQAIQLYEKLIKQDVASGSIYYNLGNAYFKIGKQGKAILNFERAERLLPDDEDVHANMNYIQARLQVKQPEEKRSFYQKAWLIVCSFCSVQTWFLITLGLFFIVCILLGIGLLNRTVLRKLLSTVLIGTFLLISVFVCFLGSYNIYKQEQNTGVIIVPQADVRYSPSYSGVVAFELEQGMYAQIIRMQDDWTQIRLTKEKSGWIPSEDIERI